MFRREKRTYSQIMLDELSEGFDHLWLAGAAAAAGVGATVGPKWAETRIAAGPPTARLRDAASYSWRSTMSAVMPLFALARVQARRASEQARKDKATKKGVPMSRKGWMIAAGMVTVGAGAGAIGAMMMRRRRRAQWEEFDARAAVDMVEGESVLLDSPEETGSTGNGVRTGSAGRGAMGNASSRHGEEAVPMTETKAGQSSKNTRS